MSVWIFKRRDLCEMGCDLMDCSTQSPSPYIFNAAIVCMHVQSTVGMGAELKPETQTRHVVLYNPSIYAHHHRLLGGAIEEDRLERLLFPRLTCSNLPVI